MVFVVAVFAAVSAAAVFLGGVEPRRIQEGQGQLKDAVSFGHALWQGLITIYTSTRMVFRIRSVPTCTRNLLFRVRLFR